MVRVVVAGCGAMSKSWLRAIQGSPELAAAVSIAGLVDRDLSRAQALASEFGLTGAICGADVDDVLAAVRPDILFDIVVPLARAEVVESGLRHGCHVLSEKPLAPNLAEANWLLDAASRAGRLHAVIQNRRYVPGIRRLRRAVEDGLIGQVTGIHCDFFIGAHFGGFRDEMEHVLLLDMAIHTFDAARFIIDEAPLNVYCHETNPPGSWYRHGAAANAIFEFDGGAVFTYRGSWCAEGARTSWEGVWRVVGTKGTILWDGGDAFHLGLVGKNGDGLLLDSVPGELPEPPDAAKTHGHASIISEFVAAVRDGTTPETVATDNIKSLGMVLSAIASAEAGKRIQLSTKDWSL